MKPPRATLLHELVALWRVGSWKAVMSVLLAFGGWLVLVPVVLAALYLRPKGAIIVLPLELAYVFSQCWTKLELPPSSAGRPSARIERILNGAALANKVQLMLIVGAFVVFTVLSFF